jgi:hypothetical protein
MTKKTKKNSKEYIEKDIKKRETALIVSHLSWGCNFPHAAPKGRAARNDWSKSRPINALLFKNVLGVSCEGSGLLLFPSFSKQCPTIRRIVGS